MTLRTLLLLAAVIVAGCKPHYQVGDCVRVTFDEKPPERWQKKELKDQMLILEIGVNHYRSCYLGDDNYLIIGSTRLALDSISDKVSCPEWLTLKKCRKAWDADK